MIVTREKIWQMVLGFLLGILVLAGQAENTPLVEVKEAQGPWGLEVTLANEFLSASFYPEWGGRLSKLIDLKTGVNLIFWDYPPGHPKHNDGWGGALDDRHGGWERKYRYTLLGQTTAEVKISLEDYFADQEILYRKIITLQKGRPQLEVEYHYLNQGQVKTKDIELGIRNFFQPSGGPPDWNCEHAFLPSIKAVREFGWERLSKKFPELADRMQSEIIPTWTGFIDKKSQRGLAFSFEDDFYRMFYRWINGESATYEWMFSPLAPGKEAVTRFNIAVTHGLTGYVDVAESYAANLIWNKLAGNQAAVGYELFPTKNMAGLAVKSSLLSIKREIILELPELKIGRVEAGKPVKKEMNWEIPPSAAILVQQVFDGETLLGEYELPAPPDAPAANYFRPQRGRKPVVINNIPGWQAEIKEAVVRPAAEDIKRGYLIYPDYFAPREEVRGKAVREIQSDLGMGEQESVALKVRIFRDLGKFKVNSGDNRLTVRIESDEPIPGAKEAGIGEEGAIGYKLNPINSFSPTTNKDFTVWLTWDSRGLKPGDYRLPVNFIPEKGETKGIVWQVKLHDVKLPERNILQFEAEGDLFGVFAGMYNWELNKVQPYIRDLGEHRINIAQVFSGMERRDFPADKVKVRSTGRLLKDELAADPELAAKSPPLNFSWFDPWFEEIIGAGLIRAYTRQNDAGDRTPEERWRMKELARYLSEKGYPYRDRYVKFIDEQPPEVFPEMARTGAIYHSLGWRVLHTSSPIKFSVQMAILNPATDLWHGGIPAREDRAARLKEGNLDATDEIWTYSGWGAVWSSYASRRHMPWACSVAQINGLHLHVYYRGSMLGALIFPTETGPAASPAWEGARDGIEDVQYFELARQWLNNLEKNGVGGKKLEELAGRLREIEKKMSIKPKTGSDVCYRDFLEVKRENLAILKELRAYGAKIKTSVVYGFTDLIVDNQAQFLISGGLPGTEFFSGKLNDWAKGGLKTGAWEKAGQDEKKGNNWLLLLLADSETCRQLNASGAIQLGTDYPAKGSYAVWQIANPEDKNHWLILIVGRDETGLQKGCRNFLKFLRVDPEQF